MGLCLSANCAAEVPVFMLSGRILDKLGVDRSFHLAMACYVLRLCCYLVRCGGGWVGGRGMDGMACAGAGAGSVASL